MTPKYCHGVSQCALGRLGVSWFWYPVLPRLSHRGGKVNLGHMERSGWDASQFHVKCCGIAFHTCTTWEKKSAQLKKFYCKLVSEFNPSSVHKMTIHVLRKTGSDISISLISDFNFTNSRFQLREFTISTSRIHEFTNSALRIQLHEFTISTVEFVVEFERLNSWFREVEFANSWSRIREFVKLNSLSGEVEFTNLNSWGRIREFVKLKSCEFVKMNS